MKFKIIASVIILVIIVIALVANKDRNTASDNQDGSNNTSDSVPASQQ
jgi:hypothetical protein